MRVAQVLVLALAAAAVLGAYVAVAEELKGAVVVYGNPKCPACKHLVSLFENAGIRYAFIDISKCGGDEYREIVEMFSLPPAIPLSVVFTSNG